MITTFAVLLLFQTMGEGIAHVFALSIPGPVIGMLLLFLYLVLKPGTVRNLAPTSLTLLKHLSLLFVPAGVGIMVHAQRLAAEWLPISASLLASTTVSIAVTALVVKWLQKPEDAEFWSRTNEPSPSGNDGVPNKDALTRSNNRLNKRLTKHLLK